MICFNQVSFASFATCFVYYEKNVGVTLCLLSKVDENLAL